MYVCKRKNWSSESQSEWVSSQWIFGNVCRQFGLLQVIGEIFNWHPAGIIKYLALNRTASTPHPLEKNHPGLIAIEEKQRDNQGGIRIEKNILQHSTWW